MLGEIRTVDSAGTNIERGDMGLTWSPDSRKIAFSSTRRGRADIYQIDLNGESLRRITQGGGDNTNPAWGPFRR